MIRRASALASASLIRGAHWIGSGVLSGGVLGCTTESLQRGGQHPEREGAARGRLVASLVVWLVVWLVACLVLSLVALQVTSRFRASRHPEKGRAWASGDKRQVISRRSRGCGGCSGLWCPLRRG